MLGVVLVGLAKHRGTCVARWRHSASGNWARGRHSNLREHTADLEEDHGQEKSFDHSYYLPTYG